MAKKSLSQQLKDGEENLRIFKEYVETKTGKIDIEIKAWRIAGFTSIGLGLFFFAVPFFLPEYGKIAFNNYGDFVGGVVASIWSLAGLIVSSPKVRPFES